LSTLSGYSDAKIYQGVILSRLRQTAGNLEAAVQEIQKAAELMRVEAPVAVREEFIAQQVRIYLAQGQLDAAEAALRQYGFPLPPPDITPDQHITQPAGLLHNSALCILLHRRETAGLKRGVELAGNLIASSLRSQYIPIALKALLLRAQMQTALGNDQSSLADYARALELAEPEGFISVFVEEGGDAAEALAHLLKHGQLGTVRPAYVEAILAAFSKSRPQTLSDRELDVLRLMAEGLTYNEVANRLFVSVNTVRTHVKAIYGKLGVSNRTQAIEQANQKQLL
jgi:LuxR family maltose regulon positive regulatory protein